MLNTYIKKKVRKVIASKDVTKDQAIRFLKTNPIFGVVADENGKQYTIEELKNVKSIKPKSGTKSDSAATSRDEISEDTDRELFGSFADYAESTSSSDNKWNKQS